MTVTATLSFVETGRSRPSRELLLHLAEHLDVVTALADELRGYPGVTERSAPPDAWS